MSNVQEHRVLELKLSITPCFGLSLQMCKSSLFRLSIFMVRILKSKGPAVHHASVPILTACAQFAILTPVSPVYRLYC